MTGNDAYRFNDKVPTLRNVELTYPYFHDGGAKTVTEAGDAMLHVSHNGTLATGAAAPVLLVVLIRLNLPVHWRVHNSRRALFPWFFDAAS